MSDEINLWKEDAIALPIVADSLYWMVKHVEKWPVDLGTISYHAS